MRGSLYRYFETPCIKLMIVSKLSDLFSNITIVLEFSKWTTQLHTILQLLPIEAVIYVKRTVHRQDFGASLNFTNNNSAPVADILKLKKVCLLLGVLR